MVRVAIGTARSTVWLLAILIPIAGCSSKSEPTKKAKPTSPELLASDADVKAPVVDDAALPVDAAAPGFGPTIAPPAEKRAKFSAHNNPTVITWNAIGQLGSGKWPLDRILDPHTGVFIYHGSEKGSERWCGTEVEKNHIKLSRMFTDSYNLFEEGYCKNKPPPSRCVSYGEEYLPRSEMVFRQTKIGLVLEAIFYLDIYHEDIQRKAGYLALERSRGTFCPP